MIEKKLKKEGGNRRFQRKICSDFTDIQAKIWVKSHLFSQKRANIAVILP